jgi:hypothetical protein
VNFNITAVKEGATLTGVFLGPWIAVQLSLRQFISQKWWERKAETYTEILEILTAINWNAGQSYSRELGEVSLGPAFKMDENSGSPLFKLERLIAAGDFVVSARTVEAVSHFIEVYAGAFSTNDLMSMLERHLQILDETINVVREEAKHNVTPTWFFSRIPKRLPRLHQ